MEVTILGKNKKANSIYSFERYAKRTGGEATSIWIIVNHPYLGPLSLLRPGNCVAQNGPVHLKYRAT